jgi:hypothetical protein
MASLRPAVVGQWRRVRRPLSGLAAVRGGSGRGCGGGGRPLGRAVGGLLRREPAAVGATAAQRKGPANVGGRRQPDEHQFARAIERRRGAHVDVGERLGGVALDFDDGADRIAGRKAAAESGGHQQIALDDVGAVEM